MKILLAPDSWKYNMRAAEVCELEERAIKSVMPDAEVVSVPMADGGEGTVDSILTATNGKLIEVPCTGPLGQTVTASYGLLPDGKTAIMEMSSASGIEHGSRSDFNPMKATTYGTGELMMAAIDKGVDNIIMGIGGSATVDGGIGMAQALGFKLLDKDGNEVARGGDGLNPIVKIDDSAVSEKVKNLTVRVACDVTNPLLGEKGSATVFGPQKGATPEMIKVLESGLSNLGKVWEAQGMIDNVTSPGDGAAGGLGAGLRAFCNASIESGAALVAEVTGYVDEVKDADLVFTGEGLTDSQTTEGGKLCAVVANIAAKYDVPVILLSGGLGGTLLDFDKMFYTGFASQMDIGTLDESMRDSKENLYYTVRNIFKMMFLGKKMLK